MTSNTVARLAALKNRIATLKGKGEEHIGTLLMTGEVMAGAYACGVAKGKLGAWNILGVPGDGALGGLTVLGSMVGVFGKHSGHATAIGAGMLASYAVTMGAAHGAGGTGIAGGVMKALGAAKGTSAVSGVGALPEPSSSELDELVAAAARVAVA